MLEKFRWDAVLQHAGHRHSEQTQVGHLPATDVPALCLSENILPLQLALFSDHVPTASQEQRPQDGTSGTW